jgi:hypothetical protein
MPIRYSSVFDDGKLVAEFPAAEYPTLSKTLATVVSSVPPREHRRQMVEAADVNYVYLSNGKGRIVGCVTTKDVNTLVAFKFLDDVESVVSGQVLQQKMEFHNDPANDPAVQASTAVCRS